MKAKIWYWIIGIAIALVIGYFVWKKNQDDKTGEEKKNLLNPETAKLNPVDPE